MEDAAILTAFTAIDLIVELAKQVKTNRTNCAVLARSVGLWKHFLAALQEQCRGDRAVSMPSLTSLNQSLQRSVEAVWHCQTTSVYSLLWNNNKVTDRLNSCLQDIEHSLNSLDLSSMNDAYGTRGLLTVIEHDLKDTKLVAAAEDAALAEDVRALVLAQAAQAIKRQLEVMLDGVDNVGCLSPDTALMTSQVPSQSTNPTRLEPGYVTQISAVLDRVASIHSANDAREQAAELGPLEGLICPISLEIMRDPVTITGSGQTCERTLAEHWFAAGHTTCPITGLKVTITELIPNHALRGVLEDWLTRQSRSTSAPTLPTETTPSSSTDPQGLNHQNGDLSPTAPSTSESAAFQLPTAVGNVVVDEDALVLQCRGDARKLCALLKAGMSVQKKALSALRTMAVDGQYAAVAAAGAVGELVQLLHVGTANCQERAADVLGILAQSSTALSTAIAMEGAIAPLVALLHTGTPTCQERAAGALANLALDNDENQVAMSRAGAIAPLVALLCTGTTACKLAATTVLRVLTTHADVVANADVRAIAALVAVLDSDTPACQEEAARALSNLAFHVEDHRAAIARAGAIPVLVALLSMGTSKGQQYAAEALGNLAFNNAGNKVSISSAGAIAPLVALISSAGAPECTLTALTALRILADHTHVAANVEAGTIAALVAVLEDDRPSCQEQATSALSSLALHVPDHRWAIAQAGAIPALVALLSTGTQRCQQYAASTLCYLTWNKAGKAPAICRAGAFGPLVTLLHMSNALELRQAATQAMGNLIFCDADAAAVAIEAGAIAPLVALLGDIDVDRQALAANVLRLLAAEVADARAAIARAGAIPALVALLSTGMQRCHEYAAEALANIASHSTVHKLAITEAGAIQPLVTLLCMSSTPGCKYAATRALAILANSNDSVVAAIIAAGAVAPLKAVQDSEPLCRKDATIALRNLGQ
eukprot:jgi/Chlat1/8537/Chrsp82S07940